MKFYFTLPLLLLAVSTAAQTSVSLLPNSTWTVTNVNFNPDLGHEYEGCWPNGTLTLANNQSGSFFTASEWTGPACEDYDLNGGEVFYIGNGSQYGYLDSNDSVQFNYNMINSSTVLLNLWYGCNDDQFCDTSADVILSIENSDLYPCILNFDSYSINVCSFSSLTFNGTGFSGLFNYTLSLLDNSVTSCDGSQNVWGTFSDYNGCHDIATQKPNYTVQNPGTPAQSSLAILFPVQQSSISSMNFQLSITLSCASGANTTVSLTDIATNTFSNLTTISLSGSSSSACAQPIGCSAVALGYSNYYNLCSLQQSNLVLSQSDGVLGELSFNLGSTPLIPNCPGNNESYVFATYTTLDDCYVLSSTAPTYSSYSSYSYSLDSDIDGLQVAFPSVFSQEGYDYIYVTIILQCNASQVAVVELNSDVSFYIEMSYASITFQGTSPYACPITPNNTESLDD